MPVEAKGTKIIEKSTGRVVGQSDSPEMAKKAATVRNAIIYGDFKPTQHRGPIRRRESSY